MTDSKVRLGFGGGDESLSQKTRIIDELKKNFKPEFINRIDEIIVFNKLTKDNILEICKNMLNVVKLRAKDLEIKVEFQPEVYHQLAKEGFDDSYGARPLRRAINSNVENLLSQYLLEGKIKKGDSVSVTFSQQNKAYEIVLKEN